MKRSYKRCSLNAGIILWGALRCCSTMKLQPMITIASLHLLSVLLIGIAKLSAYVRRLTATRLYAPTSQYHAFIVDKMSRE